MSELATATQAPYSFVLPESFDPSEFLKDPQLRGRLDDARYFVGTILRKLAHRDVDERGLVRLHAAFLRNVMEFRIYAAVVDALVAGGAVERFGYRPGEKSFGYRLADRYIDDRHVRVQASDPRLIRRLDLFHQRQAAERAAGMKPVHHALAKRQHRLRIHGDRAREVLARLPRESNPNDVQGVLVADIERGDFQVRVGRYGRLANNVTSMKRELREHLHVGGRHLASVDLRCAQPAFVAALMQADGARRETGGREADGRETDTQAYMMCIADYADYRSLVQTGRFYDAMTEELSEHGLTRDEVKKRFLADVIAKRKANRFGAEYPSAVENAFRRRFPSVYHFIRRVNRDGFEHENLIRMLQSEEATLVIEGVAADLVTRFPQLFVLTLHDAVYVTAEHIEKVEQAFHRAFDQTGFPMALKVA